MKPWIDIYKERLNNQYYEYFCKQYAPFLEQLRKYHTGTNHELGCGMGNSTRHLTFELNRNKYYCYDLCPEMLGLAMKNIESDQVFYRNVDIRNLYLLTYPPDLVHSHGVLEHFSDNDIKKILDIGMADTQVHYVPSDKWITPSRGDERLLSKQYWEDHFHPDEVIEFNQGKDLVLIWR